MLLVYTFGGQALNAFGDQGGFLKKSPLEPQNFWEIYWHIFLTVLFLTVLF